MCGIAGILGRGDETTLDGMLDCIRHRGPDEAGRHLAPDAGLWMGMRRLSIVDLAGGSQPIHNEDGSVSVTFNGEIYNYPTLREELEGMGHRFETDSDTEVLVHLWEEYGERTPEHLNGMFAFAIWDADTGTLFLARDRLGIKPLYYTRTATGTGENAVGESLAWGSELPAVLAAGIDRTLDERAVYNFFSLRYSPWPATLFEHVRKLPPGTTLTVSTAGDGLSLDRRRYWDIDAGGRTDETSPAAASRRVHDLLEQSVRRRLMADVPVGAFLSGGLDSSATVGFAARHHEGTLKTFSVGFPGADQDESDEAQLVADHFGTDHHRLDIDLSSMDAFGDLVRHYGEPLADPAALPTMLLSRYACDEVKVVLTGEGADELFAGYHRHRLIPRHRRVARRLPSTAFSLADRIRDATSGAESVGRYTSYAASLASDERAVLDAARRYSDLRPEAYLDTEETAASSGLEALVDDAVDHAVGGETLQRLCAFDLRHWLPDDLLYKVDGASMAASLEARVPFLDHELVEYVVGLPAELKTDGYKGVLSRAVADLVPRRTRERSKHGFDVPVSTWFREDHEAVARWLTEENVRETPFLDPADVAALRDVHRRGERDHGMTLWKVLTYVAWYHEHAVPE